MRLTQRITGWFRQYRRKIAEVGVGMTLYATFNWAFNYPLYIAVVAYYGLVKGGLIMFLLSLIQNIALLFLYDRMKIDWVGAGYLEEVQFREGNKTRTQRALLWALKEEARGKGHRFFKAVGFVLLSIFVDPFVVSVHYRRFQFLGVSRRDLGILTASVVIGNLYWTIRTGVLVEIAKAAWERL